MTEELSYEITRMNLLEKELLIKWGRGDNISEELLKQLDQSRAKIKELQNCADNKTINHD